MLATSRLFTDLLAAPFIHRAGPLEVRVAATAQEIVAAQMLRYRVFHEEMGATPTALSRRLGRDIDDHDEACDHLLVLNHDGATAPRVVGTYRLLRQAVAERHGGFCSAGEYDLSPLLETARRDGGQLLELGRSCVAPEHRNSATIALLWRGIASYLAAHRISHMFGCASLHGTDPRAFDAELSYLHHHHLAAPHLRARALEHVPMDRIPADRLDARQASRALPPLIKGYLRVGAVVGDGAFVDRAFNTVDVFVVMPVDRITGRYLDRFASADA